METRFQSKGIIVLLLFLNLTIMSALLLVQVSSVAASTGCFPDTNGHWAEIFICWLSDNGIAGGYPDGTYRPENPITRAEMAVMLKNMGDMYETRIADLETLLASASLENGGNDLLFSGVNLHVRDGSGSTSGTNGLGNLIIGYNEDEWVANPRNGSHNLVVGDNHTYSSYGGIVGGQYNSITGEHASVLGGSDNASISGGYNNTASGVNTSVSGGEGNSAIGGKSSICGGYDNTANGFYSTISGGEGNSTFGSKASVFGGEANQAIGDKSTVLGGWTNSATGGHGSILGGVLNVASGDYSSVSGGYDNLASGIYSVVSGGQNNEAGGNSSTIGGGANGTVTGGADWLAGTLFEEN